MENFGTRLKRFRESKELTIKHVASELQVPISTYRDWECGREIKGEPYVKIANVLGVSLYELLTGEAPTAQQAYEKIYLIEQACAELRKELASL